MPFPSTVPVPLLYPTHIPHSLQLNMVEVPPPTETDVKALFQAADLDKSGELSKVRLGSTPARLGSTRYLEGEVREDKMPW